MQIKSKLYITSKHKKFHITKILVIPLHTSELAILCDKWYQVHFENATSATFLGEISASKTGIRLASNPSSFR